MTNDELMHSEQGVLLSLCILKLMNIHLLLQFIAFFAKLNRCLNLQDKVSGWRYSQLFWVGGRLIDCNGRQQFCVWLNIALTAHWDTDSLSENSLCIYYTGRWHLTTLYRLVLILETQAAIRWIWPDVIDISHVKKQWKFGFQP